MKYLKSFNESLRDKMIPKTEDNIIKSLDELNPNEMLYQSIKNSYIKGIEMAIAKGVDLNYENRIGSTPLFYAFHDRENNKNEIAEFLIKNGADINYQNVLGDTVLMEEIMLEYEKTVEFLIKNGADLNIQNKKGETALIKAAMFGCEEVGEILITSGADVNIKDKKGHTALYYARKNNYSKKLISLLTEKSAKK